MAKKIEYTVKLGAQLIIWITGETRRYIAEVTKVEPLEMKVEEIGVFSRLKDGDYIILAGDSSVWQKGGPGAPGAQEILQGAAKRGRPLLSGLHSLGVESGTLHEIHPVK